MKKLASFTIIELMITLLISTIVISMGYFAYFLLNRQFDRYLSRTSKIKEYSLLATAWQIDFDRADRIVDTVDKAHILFNRGDTVIRYSINDSSVIRESGQSRDSFALRAVVLDTRLVDDSLPLVKAITLGINLNQTTVLLPGIKTYSAREIMLTQKSPHE
jgi:hypothetical protein